ncbi:MAG TPA: ferritin family protein [Anaeromyxobacteraceae bacterium]|nr:ferritin family protein [Anaeromyxobacteraceae bacterium]
MSVHALFAASERVELLAAEMYRLLAERFASREPVRALFRKLHEEEIQHASRVRLLAAQYRNDSGLFRDAALFDGAPDPRELVVEIEAMVRAIEGGAWGTDLGQIRARVVEMEKRCVTLHAQFLVAGAPEAISSFFRELARQDEAHERLLANL